MKTAKMFKVIVHTNNSVWLTPEKYLEAKKAMLDKEGMSYTIYEMDNKDGWLLSYYQST